MALFPSKEEALAFSNLAEMLDWAGLDQAPLTAIEKLTGGFANKPRNLALLPPTVLRDAASKARVVIPAAGEEAAQEITLTPVQSAQIGLIRCLPVVPTSTIDWNRPKPIRAL